MFILYFSQSTSPSHSVTANYQQVLASMKCHSALCGVVASGKVKSPKREADFKSLLKSLEEEFGRLTLYVTMVHLSPENQLVCSAGKRACIFAELRCGYDGGI